MTDWTTSATQLLPPRLQEFVRLIGLPATMALVQRFGGLRIYIPATATPDHAFAEVIGLENLAKLSAEIGVDGTGDRFLLPKADRALIAVRDARIRAEFATKSTRMLAAEYGLTERHITRIVGPSAPKNGDQAVLFG